MEILHSTIIKLLDKHCPRRKCRVPVNKPYITSPLISKLKRAKKNAYDKGNPVWKFLSKQLSSLHKSALKQLTDNKINNVIKGTKSWWNNIKQLTGETAQSNTAPAIFIEDNWLSLEEFPTKLNDFYLRDHSDVAFPEIPPEGNPIQVTEMDVFKQLENIDTRKATSSADFPGWISKNNSHIMCSPVTHIINSIISSGSYPTLWKKAEVSPLPKVKHPSLFKDMRPISLLFHLGKITERLIAQHLRSELPVMENQYAYTPSLGTTDALVKFTTDIIDSLDSKECLGVRALMLDFSKAFDRMKPDIAIDKLVKLGINPTVIHLIRSFLSGRAQCVRYRGYMSPYQQCHIGVPQGTILGPLLWNVYINDLTPHSAKYIKYADDSTAYHPIMKTDIEILSSTKQASNISIRDDCLQQAADYATEWCNANSMLINATKSNSIIFSLKKQVNTPPIMINNSAVADDDTVKLLGVTFDRHLRFNHHVNTIIDKCRPNFHAICRLRKAGVNSASLAYFYQSRIVPLLTYASPCWFPLICKSDSERLERYQRHCLRVIYPELDNTDTRLETTGLDDICVRLNTQCLNYTHRVKGNDNHPLHQLSSTGRISGRSGRHIPEKSRTALRSKSLFHRFC